jgi:DNA-binding NtrC family response regulator
LAKHFAERAALRFGLPIVEPSLADVKLLSDYNWPGNIRELGAVIDRAAILGEGRGLATEKALGFGSQMKLPSMHPPTSTYSEGDQYSKWSLDAVMKGHIERALGQSQGKIEGRDGAAKLLDINPNTLRARMRTLNIKWQNFRNSNASTGD